MCNENQNWIVDWRSDYIRRGARFVIKDKEGNSQGRLEFLSKPEIEFGDNNGYVTVKIRAACIGSDGKPVTNVKLEKEVGDNDIALVTVITDGYENASREYSGKMIQDMVKRLDAKGWVFTYIGANQDAMLEARLKDRHLSQCLLQLMYTTRESRRHLLSMISVTCHLMTECRSNLFKQL